MNIGAVESIYEYRYQKVDQTTAKEADFSKELENTADMDPLAYYKKLCSEFSDITFRLDDKSAAIKNGGEAYLGYNNSLNQIGGGFGDIGRCSISIDIAVIEKMQKDPKYEEAVKGMIKFSQEQYAEDQAFSAKEGFPYICICIEGDDGSGYPQRSVVASRTPFSTEEEIKSMHAKHSSTNVLKKFEADRRSMVDDFLERLDASHRKQTEFWRRKGKSEINGSKGAR